MRREQPCILIDAMFHKKYNSLTEERRIFGFLRGRVSAKLIYLSIMGAAFMLCHLESNTPSNAFAKNFVLAQIATS